MLHRIFVYGTLKQGFPNFHINRGRRVPGHFVTVQRYPLFILGDAHLPWLVQQPGAGHAVTGELYEVDDDGLAAMDVLEQISEPGWDHREHIAVQAAVGAGLAQAAVQAFVYFGTAPRVASETVHAGPLPVYSAEHAKTYREES